MMASSPLIVHKKKTSADQLNALADFVANNKVMLHGKTKPAEASLVESLWDELTTILNSCGSGPVRSKVQWKKTFVDWKCNTKRMARKNLQSRQLTGGGEDDQKKLSSAEEKLMSSLTWVSVKGNEEVKELGMESEEEGEESFLPEKSPLTSNNGNIICTKMATPSPSCPKRATPPAPSSKSSNLKSMIHMYAAAQKEAKAAAEAVAVPDDIRRRELELKEMELKLRFHEANLRKAEKEREFDLRERELQLRERELEFKLKQIPHE